MDGYSFKLLNIQYSDLFSVFFLVKSEIDLYTHRKKYQTFSL